MELRGRNSDVGQLRDKLKRVVRSRSETDLDHEPVRLERKSSKSSSEAEGMPAIEEEIKPVAAGSQEGARYGIRFT